MPRVAPRLAKRARDFSKSSAFKSSAACAFLEMLNSGECTWHGRQFSASHHVAHSELRRILQVIAQILRFKGYPQMGGDRALLSAHEVDSFSLGVEDIPRMLEEAQARCPGQVSPDVRGAYHYAVITAAAAIEDYFLHPDYMACRILTPCHGCGDWFLSTRSNKEYCGRRRCDPR